MAKIEVEYQPAKDAYLAEKVRRSSRTNAAEMHFTWDSTLPRLVLTSDTPNFDPNTITRWKAEGFAVTYLPYEGDHKAYHNSLQHLADPLELGDKYAIVGM